MGNEASVDISIIRSTWIPNRRAAKTLKKERVGGLLLGSTIDYDCIICIINPV